MENQLSRYGALSKFIPDLAPNAKVFFVGDSDDTGFVDFVNEFPPDKDGVVRVYSSMFDSTMVANLKANRDVVVVMPGYNETITTDKSLSVAGIRYVGLGSGNNRPTITFNNTAASVSLDAANISLENFRLFTSISAVTRGVDVVGAGCSIKKCLLAFDATGDDFVTGIRVEGVDHVAIEDNEILMENAAGHTAGIVYHNSDFGRVLRNKVIGDFTDAGINMSDSTAACLGSFVADNYVFNQDTDGVTIRNGATSTGLFANNRLATGDTVEVAAAVVAGAGRWVENYLVNDTGETGTLVPRVASTT